MLLMYDLASHETYTRSVVSIHRAVLADGVTPGDMSDGEQPMTSIVNRTQCFCADDRAVMTVAAYCDCSSVSVSSPRSKSSCARPPGVHPPESVAQGRG